MFCALRELQVEGNLPIQELLPDEGKLLPALAAPCLGIDDDFHLSGPFLQQAVPSSENPRSLESLFTYQIMESLTRFFNLKKDKGCDTV